MESVPISAVPASVMAHDERLGAVAFPAAVHAIVEPLSVPSAVPATFKSFAHVALNDPFAVVAVCSVTFHLKSVQDEGDGTTDADVQLPIKALTPEAEGPVSVLVCSNPKQPASETAASAAKKQANRCLFIEVIYRLEDRTWVVGEG
jgi:hypothetical protein